MVQQDASSNADIMIQPARESDVPSLTTIVSRAFHPVNAFVKQCFPDTPAVRAHWARVFGAEIAAPGECHVLSALDTAHGGVVGVLCLRRLDGGSRGAGLWTLFPPGRDTDAALFQPAIDFMVVHRERLFCGPGARPHFLLELFAVDHAVQRRGVGRRLLAAAAELADAARCDVFVQANGAAAPFYARYGFRELERAKMPGELEYEECLMLRPVKAES